MQWVGCSSFCFCISSRLRHRIVTLPCKLVYFPFTQRPIMFKAASEVGIPVDTQGTSSYLMIPSEAIDFHFWAGRTITEIIEFSPWMGFPVITEIRDPARGSASTTGRFVLLFLRQLYNTQSPCSSGRPKFWGQSSKCFLRYNFAL